MLQARNNYQTLAERRPDHFIRYEYPKLLSRSRHALASFLKLDASTVVFVANATTGVNTVLRNLTYSASDRILYFSTTYGACEKTILYLEESTPVRGVSIPLTYPVSDDALLALFQDAIQAERAAGHRVRLALFDTVVSLPGVRMPFERLVRVCRAENVLSMVDGAHGVGHLDLDLVKLDADFFTSNCHKSVLSLPPSTVLSPITDNHSRWLFAPRGAAVLYVPTRNQALIRSSLPTSWGYLPPPDPTQPVAFNPFPAIPGETSFTTQFLFVGTVDPSPYLCVYDALRWIDSTCGGFTRVLEYNTQLARDGGRALARLLGTEVMENAEGSLGECMMTNVSLPLGDKVVMDKREMMVVISWMGKVMREEKNTFIAIMLHGGRIWARVSGQVYLEMDDFVFAARVLRDLCARVELGEHQMSGVKVTDEGVQNSGEP